MADKKQAAIASGIRRLGAKGFEIMAAYVKSVDEAKGQMSVTCYDNEQELDGVLLHGTDEEGTSGMLIIPKVGSDVVIGSVDGPGEWVLLRASEVDKLVLTAAVKVEIHCDDVEINDGSNGGVPTSPKLKERLNKIESDLNTLKQVFSGWAPSGGDGGAALKSAAATWAGQQLTETEASDIENTKVKH